MTERDPKADNLDIAIGWLQKSIDELSDVTRRVRREVGTHGRPDTPRATTTKSEPPAPSSAPACPALPTSWPSRPPDHRLRNARAATSTTPLLDRIGRDLTKLARRGLLAPVFEREEETALDHRDAAALDQAQPGAARTAGRGQDRDRRGPRPADRRGQGAGRAQGDAADRDARWPRSWPARSTAASSRSASSSWCTKRPSRTSSCSSTRSISSSRPGDRGRSWGGGGAQAGAGARRHRGDRGDDGRRVPDDDRARRLARAATVDAGGSGARLGRDAAHPQGMRDRIATSRGVTVNDDALQILLDFRRSLDQHERTSTTT